jgi:hypothetical protein
MAAHDMDEIVDRIMKPVLTQINKEMENVADRCAKVTQ